LPPAIFLSCLATCRLVWWWERRVPWTGDGERRKHP
jgi:hypothetical protein